MTLKESSVRRVLEVAGSNFGRSGLSTMVYNWAMMLPREELKLDFFSVKPFEESRYTKDIKARGGELISVGIPKGQAPNPVVVYHSLRAHLQKTHYDVVHIHCDCAYKAIVYALCAKRCGIKIVIVHSHSAGMENISKKKQLINSVCRSILPVFTNTFFSCSDRASAWMFPRRVLPEVTLVGNDINIKRFTFNESARERAREQFKINESMRVVGFMGRLMAQKNPEGLVRIFSAIARADDSVLFLLVGDGELRGLIEENIKNEGIADKTIRVLHADRPEQCYSAMDAFCLPSNFEGNPLVVAEAQASGLPCFVSTEVSKDCDPLGQVTFIPKDDTSKWATAILNASIGLADRAERAERYKDYFLNHQSSCAILLKAYGCPKGKN